MGICKRMAWADSQKPVQMLLQAKDAAAVAAEAFEHAVAVEQAVIVDADLGVFLVVKPAVDVNLQRPWACVRVSMEKGRWGMTNDELRMTDQIRITNDERDAQLVRAMRIRNLRIRHSFVI